MVRQTAPDAAILEPLKRLSIELMTRSEEGKLLSFPFNLVKAVHSQASAREYRAILRGNECIDVHLALISFPLVEYLCFAGHEREVYELSIPDIGFGNRTTCRLDNDFWEVVFTDSTATEYTQVFGVPDLIRSFKGGLADAKEYLKSPLKTFFTIALGAPVVEDEVLNTALRRSLIRFAVAGLNRFADVHRTYVGIAWSVFPHYSFFSFPYGYVREFDLGGRLISSDKYLMNPAIGVLPQRPFISDPSGSARRKFQESLLADEEEDEWAAFCKGESYAGHGHDLAALRLCVSAVDALLRRWAKEGEVALRDSTPEKARLKTILGKFEEHMKARKIVEKPDEFLRQVKGVINLRHAVEHEGFSSLDSTTVFPAVEILKRFFGLVRAEIESIRQGNNEPAG